MYSVAISPPLIPFLQKKSPFYALESVTHLRFTWYPLQTAPSSKRPLVRAGHRGLAFQKANHVMTLQAKKDPERQNDLPCDYDQDKDRGWGSCSVPVPGPNRLICLLDHYINNECLLSNYCVPGTTEMKTDTVLSLTSSV